MAVIRPANRIVLSSIQVSSPLGEWPLEVSSNGKYLQKPDGTPFLINGDTPWSLINACTNAQIDTYLADRAAKGCTAILIALARSAWSPNTPRYNDVDGNAPFTNMSPVNWVMNNAFWNRIDYIVNECKTLGMVVMINPAYTGYGNGNDGWLADYAGVSDATLQSYGEALANRYTQGNVMWCLGGDDANDSGVVGAYESVATPDRTKQWQIVVGIRNVRTTDIVTGHTGRNGNATVDGEAYAAWNGYPGFNLNNTYGHDDTDDMVGLATTASGRAMPFCMLEAGYENIDTNNTTGRIPWIQSFLGGGLVGGFAGHDELWHMGSESATSTATTLTSYLAGSWTDHERLGDLLALYSWHLLEPTRDTSLVTTSLGTGSNAIVPALASDGSFAMIFTPSVNFTVAMTALTPASVRGRWWNPTTGAFTTATGSPFSNTGTQAFTAPGERILVLDGA